MKESLFYIIMFFTLILVFNYVDKDNWNISFIVLFGVLIGFVYRKKELDKYEKELIEKINGNIKYRKELTNESM